MIKIVLVCNLLLSLLFSFSVRQQERENASLLSFESQNCSNVYDSIVNITTQTNLISVSGVIVARTNNYIYIATSYLNYDKNYNYEVIFSDYSRKKASVVGVAKEDQILLLKIETKDNYCIVNYSRSELIDKGEHVDIVGANNYQYELVTATIDEIGVCRNCEEQTYKYYHYTRITIEVENSFLGAGVFDKKGQLLGLVTTKLDRYNYAIGMLDVNKLVTITFSLINNGKYEKNYIKYNLLNVNSLTNYDKYLYSLDEGLTQGVLVGSIHYLNYFLGGLNQGMVIYEVEGIKVNNCYELDNELAKYKKGSKVELKVRMINGKDKVYRVKV